MSVNGADVQIEQGGYTRIHNAILEQMAARKFTGNEIACLLHLLRMTYGFSRKEYKASNGDFEKATGIDRSNVSRALNRLVDNKVVMRSDAPEKTKPTWSFNKYFEQWTVKLRGTICCQNNNRLDDPNCCSNDNSTDPICCQSNNSTVVDSTTDDCQNNNRLLWAKENSKETSKERSSPPSKKATKKPRKSKQPKTPAVPTEQQELFGALCKCVGWDYRTITEEQRGQVAQTSGVLKEAGYGVEELRRFWSEIWAKDWRHKGGDKYPTLSIVRADIGKIRNPSPNGSGPAAVTVNVLEKFE